MRPLGVTILAILYGVGGVLSIISGIALLALTPMFAKVMGPMYGFMGVMTGGAGITSLVFGVIGVVIAYGLWKLRDWARLAVIVISIIGILWSLGNLAFMLPFVGMVGEPFIGGMIMSVVVGLVIYVVIIWYMMKVKDAFH